MVNALVDYLTPPGVVPLQRAVDNFDGDTLNERWTITGSPTTSAMVDAIDEGYGITGSGTQAYMTFNGIQHYSKTGAVFIGVVRRVTTTRMLLGLSESTSSNDYFLTDNSTTTSFHRLLTKDATSSSNTDSSIAVDTIWHKHEGELKTSSSTLKIDDVLEVVHTTNLPSVDLNPRMHVMASSEGRIRYYEVYNT